MKTVYIIFSFIFLLYLALPTLPFPEKPGNVLQSTEPADVESPSRIAYFTNYDRDAIVKHYLGVFNSVPFNVATFLTLRLNYPPEESQVIIRDQTRSSYLEEVAHPLRESIFINGFIPMVEKDNIFIEEKKWQQKVTVRYVESNWFVRLFVGVFILIFIKVLYDAYRESFLLLLGNLTLIKKSK